MDEQLSICIPTYNRPSLIKRALDGALNQVDFKGEIVVCDNSENSETENVIASYSSTRIRYLRHGKNIGIAGNWNALLHMAKGKYVKFLNDDDEFLPECISTIKKALKALGKEVGVITCCAEYVDDFGNIIKRDRPKNAWGKVNYFVPPKYIPLLWCYDAIPLRTPTHMVYNREAALSLGGFREDLDYTRDVQLALEIASEYGALILDEKPLVRFRFHQGQDVHGLPLKTRLENLISTKTWAVIRARERGADVNDANVIGEECIREMLLMVKRKRVAESIDVFWMWVEKGNLTSIFQFIANNIFLSKRHCDSFSKVDF